MSLVTLVAWLIHLPLPGSAREEVAMNLSVGAPSERILDALMV